MSDTPNLAPAPAAPAPSRSRNALIWAAIAAATVATVGGAGFLIHRSNALGTTPQRDELAIAVNDQYLVFLSAVEVDRSKISGSKWDMTDGGPDVRYDVYWRGNRIFRSSVCGDTLLALWDQSEVGFRDLVQGVSPERSSKAARITAQAGETIEFRIIDEDPFEDDEVGRWSVAVDSLHTGEQAWSAPAPGVLRAVCRVLRAGSGRPIARILPMYLKQSARRPCSDGFSAVGAQSVSSRRLDRLLGRRRRAKPAPRPRHARAGRCSLPLAHAQAQAGGPRSARTRTALRSSEPSFPPSARNPSMPLARWRLQGRHGQGPG